jgi:hypothetical protein
MYIHIYKYIYMHIYSYIYRSAMGYRQEFDTFQGPAQGMFKLTYEYNYVSLCIFT